MASRHDVLPEGQEEALMAHAHTETHTAEAAGGRETQVLLTSIKGGII